MNCSRPMRTGRFILFLLCCYCCTRVRAQVQAGIAVLPVFDVIKLFPDNEIHGTIGMVNFGCFLNNRLSFGINPIFGRVSNTYDVSGFAQREITSIHGLNAYLRYYAFNNQKFRLFVTGSAGVAGFNSIKRGHPDGFLISRENRSMLAAFGGAGGNYFIHPAVAIEINLLYSVLLFSDSQHPLYFTTIVPTAGIQFYLERRPGSRPTAK